jgi:SAM-dependent methyltransferase
MNKTYDFVKQTKRDKYFELRQREIEFLIHQDTGKIKREFAEPVQDCLICNSGKRNCVFQKEGFSFYRCLECGFIYADPQIREDMLMEAYKGSGANDAWIDVLLSSVNMGYDTAKYERGIDKIESVTKRSGRVLDIGCSIGLFLKVARDRGWDTIGLEVNGRAVTHAREEWGLNVSEKLLHEAAFPDASFDAVSLWGVIEHLKDPVSVINEIRRILKNGGALITFCPNVESLVCRVMREHTSCFDGRNHCGYFSPSTITYLFEKCGFEVLEIESYQPELDTILNYVNFEPPYVKGFDMPNPVRDLIGPAMVDVLEGIILDRRLGYKMMTLGRKKEI